jgi:predicted ATPase
MTELFQIKNINLTTRSPVELNITSANNKVLEISLLGSAIQRVLESEILFQCLILSKGEKRIFFIEEPEAFLSSTNSLKYFKSLSSRAKDHSIQLIVTTKSQIIIDCFPSSDQRVLF